jgi:hypothetical protein
MGAAVKVHCLAALILLVLVACSRQPEVARHTVQDYRADKSLRQDTFKWCANDPGTLGKSPDCINAREAERLESIGSLRDSGPLGLDAKKRQ